MSTDYSIFLRHFGDGRQAFAPLCQVDGVGFEGRPRILGLHSVTCSQLSASHQEVMAQEYGNYGLNVNWEIKGTYDKENDIFELMERLHRCAAALVNSDVNRPLSLMRNAESFLVFNTERRLILAPTYLDALPVIRSLFSKPFAVENFAY